MEWITQAALGALIGEWILGRQLGKRSLALGAALGVLPNIDVLFSLCFNLKHALLLREGPTHSLAFILLAAIASARGFKTYWQQKKVTPVRAASLVLGVLASHVFLQLLTAEGVAILWPFSSQRIAFNLLQQPDYPVALPLIFAAVWRVFQQPPKLAKGKSSKQTPRQRPRQIVRNCLVMSAGYLVFCAAMKARVASGIDADLKRRGVSFSRHMESPAAFSCLLWRAVVDRGDEFWVGYRSPFESSAAAIRWTIFPKGQAALGELEIDPEVRTLKEVSRGWWLVRPTATGIWLGDLCHGESRRWGDKKTMVDSRMALAWSFQPTAKGERLRPIVEHDLHSDDFLRRAGQRILNQTDAWEANPRLAGVPGSLPEFLPIVP